MEGFFTQRGLNLAAKLSGGETLQIVKVTAGSGLTTASASQLAQEKQILSVNSPVVEGTCATIPATLVAASASSDYTATEVGVYADDPDIGTILYKVYQLDEPMEVHPSSSLVVRFLLEETLVSDGTVSVTCSPAGLITQADFLPVRQKAMGIMENAATSSVAAADLQARINSLPRCLTQDVTFIVSGSLTGALTIQDFYGNGSLTVRGNTDSSFSLTGTISVENCSCPVRLLYHLTVQLPADASASDACLIANSCSYVELEEVNLQGSGTGRGVNASRSWLRLNNTSISQAQAALMLSYGAGALLINTLDSVSYTDNQTGIYLYRGGIAMLTQGVPTLLGGASNSKNGGIIIDASGALI